MNRPRMSPPKLIRTLSLLSALITALVTQISAANAALDAEGYIRHWLMLAPISLPEGVNAGEALLREQIPNESKLRPQAGDTVTVRTKALTWKAVQATTNYFDFNETLKSPNDRAVGYIVAYVECDEEIPRAILAVASNDQGRIYFNGVDIYAFTEARPLMLDADKGRITLKKGTNILVFKIINEQNSWQGAMRLLDSSGSPLKNVRIKLQP